MMHDAKEVFLLFYCVANHSIMLDLLAIIFYMSCFIRILNCIYEFEKNKLKKKKKKKNEK